MDSQKPDPNTPPVDKPLEKGRSLGERFLDSESGRALIFLGFAALLGILGLQRLATYDEAINDVRKSAEARYLEERKLVLDQYKEMSDSINGQFESFSKGLTLIAQDTMKKVIAEEKQILEDKQEQFMQETKQVIHSIEQRLEPFQWLQEYKYRTSSLSSSGIQTMSIAYALAREMFSEGASDAALEIASFAVTNNLPGDTSDYFNFSTLMSQYDQTPVAANIVDVGLKHYPKDVDLIAQGINTNKSAGRHARAQELLSELADISKESWPWRAFVFSGDFLIETGRIAEGLHTYAEFRKYIPADERGYSLPGEYLRGKGRYEEALSILEQGSERIPRSAQTNLTLAQIYIQVGRYGDAVVAASRALEANSESQPSVSQAGVLWTRATAMDSLIHQELQPDFDTDKRSVDIDKVLRYVRSCISDYRLSMNMTDTMPFFVMRGSERIKILRELVARTGVAPDEIGRIFDERSEFGQQLLEMLKEGTNSSE